MKSFLLILFTILIITSACAPVAPQSSISSQDIIATNVAATIAAMPTFTPAPTNTPEPTATAIVTPSETPTVMVFPSVTPLPSLTPFVTATSTPAKPGEGLQENGAFSCQVTGTDPKNKTKIGPSKGFNMVWTVQNMGTNTWDSAKMNVKYVSGSKMQGNDNIWPLPANVPPQGSVQISIDMTTPKKEGDYTMIWGIYQGNTLACTLAITIKVGK